VHLSEAWRTQQDPRRLPPAEENANLLIELCKGVSKKLKYLSVAQTNSKRSDLIVAIKDNLKKITFKIRSN
jgi:hypothetical protein